MGLALDMLIRLMFVVLNVRSSSEDFSSCETEGLQVGACW